MCAKSYDYTDRPTGEVGISPRQGPQGLHRVHVVGKEDLGVDAEQRTVARLPNRVAQGLDLKGQNGLCFSAPRRPSRTQGRIIDGRHLTLLAAAEAPRQRGVISTQTAVEQVHRK
jgi:hypothetical protein